MQLYYGLLAWIVLVMKRWWNALGASENLYAPNLLKSASPSIQNDTAPLRAPSRTLMGFIVICRIVQLVSGLDMVWVFFNRFI